MKRIILTIVLVSIIGLLILSYAVAHDDKKCDRKDKVKAKAKFYWNDDWNCDMYHNWHWDFSDLEDLEGLEALESLEALEGLEALENLDFDFDFDFDFNFDHCFESLKHMEDIWCHMPAPPNPVIALPVPPLPAVQTIDTDFFSHFQWDWDGWDTHKECEDLTEEEELRLYALSALGKLDGDESLPILTEVLREEGHPAIRSRALSVLNKIDDDRIVPILGEVAKNDPDYRVRKRAIYYLGKSDDKRALKILKEIIEK